MKTKKLIEKHYNKNDNQFNPRWVLWACSCGNSPQQQEKAMIEKTIKNYEYVKFVNKYKKLYSEENNVEFELASYHSDFDDFIKEKLISLNNTNKDRLLSITIDPMSYSYCGRVNQNCNIDKEYSCQFLNFCDIDNTFFCRLFPYLNNIEPYNNECKRPEDCKALELD